MGPLWSYPLQHGADIIIYSANKYRGGHSYVIAGAVLSKGDLIKRVKTLRTFLGNMASPHTCWLLLQILVTLKVRIDQQAKNALEVAQFLIFHPSIEKVLFLDNLDKESDSYRIYKE